MSVEQLIGPAPNTGWDGLRHVPQALGAAGQGRPYRGGAGEMLGREVVHAYALGEDARRERQEGGDSRVVWAGNELLVPRPAALASGYAKHAVGGHAEPRRDWCTRAGQREVRDEIARRGNPRDCVSMAAESATDRGG